MTTTTGPSSPFPDPPPYTATPTPSLYPAVISSDCEAPVVSVRTGKEKEGTSHTHPGIAVFLIVARAALYVYFGWQLQQHDGPSNASVLTQYKTSNALCVLLVLLAFALLGVTRRIGSWSSLLCITALLADGYMTFLTASAVQSQAFYVNLLPNLAGALLCHKIAKN